MTDGRGGWRLCRVRRRGGPGRVEPVGEVCDRPVPTPLVTVAFAPVKGDRPEWAVQKLTELGVDRVVLLRTDRSVVRWDDRRTAGHLERLRRVARQALMQSRGRGSRSRRGLGRGGGRRGAPGAAAGVAGRAAAALSPHPTVLVGPEGGWSPDEEATGVARVGLGPGGACASESGRGGGGRAAGALRAGVGVAPVTGRMSRVVRGLRARPVLHQAL